MVASRGRADRCADERPAGVRSVRVVRRSGVGARAVELYAQLDGLMELARGTTTADGRPAIADGATRQRLGRCFQSTNQRNLE